MHYHTSIYYSVFNYSCHHIKLHTDKKTVVFLCLYCDFLTVSTAMTNNWNVVTINNWKHSHNCQAWLQICLQDPERCAHSSPQPVIKVWFDWRLVIVLVTVSTNNSRPALADQLSSHSFLWWSWYWLDFNRFTSCIDLTRVNWTRFSHSYPWYQCLIKIGQDLYFQKECGTHLPLLPPSHTRAPMNIIQ